MVDFTANRVKFWITCEDIVSCGLFSSSFAAAMGRAPTLKDFPDNLMPNHKNTVASAKSGHFADRFRDQVRDRPATTISLIFPKMVTTFSTMILRSAVR